MKKKSCLTLALILVMMQIVSVFAVLPTAAETNNSYNIYQIDDTNAPTEEKKSPNEDVLEGAEAWLAEWDKIPAQSLVTNGANAERPAETSFSGTVKAAWSPVAGDANRINIYFLLDVKDNTNNTAYATNSAENKTDLDCFTFGFVTDNTTTGDARREASFYHPYSSDKATSTGAATDNNNGQVYTAKSYSWTWGNLWRRKEWNVTNSNVSAFYLVDRNTEGYMAQVHCVIDKPASGQFSYDVMVQDCFYNVASDGVNTTKCEEFSLAGTAFDQPYQAGYVSGVAGNIVDNPISVTTTAGASIRVDTTNEEHSGIRFATTVDVARLNALVAAGATVTTGTLIIPTATLGNTDFTIEGLTAAGLEAGKDYYNVVNQGNEWVTDNPGTWYGTLYNVKNFERQFSGVGYVTVTLNGSSYTVYGGYTAANARSIKDVAQAAIDAEIYKDNATAMGILQGFTGGSVTR